MAVTMTEAAQIVRKKTDGGKIISAIEYEDKFLFIAYWADPDEGMFDPFFSVVKSSGEFSDFSPQDYPNPLEVINKLKAAAKA